MSCDFSSIPAGFTDSYLKYLKSLSDNNIREDLYRAVRKVQNEINAQANSIKSVERAFAVRGASLFSLVKIESQISESNCCPQEHDTRFLTTD